MINKPNTKDTNNEELTEGEAWAVKMLLESKDPTRETKAMGRHQEWIVLLRSARKKLKAMK